MHASSLLLEKEEQEKENGVRSKEHEQKVVVAIRSCVEDGNCRLKQAKDRRE